MMEIMKVQLFIAAICVVCVESYPAADSRATAADYLRQYYMAHDTAAIMNDAQDEATAKTEENNLMRDDNMRQEENYNAEYDDSNYQSDYAMNYAAAAAAAKRENYAADRNTAAAEEKELLLSQNDNAAELWNAEQNAAADLNTIYDTDMERRMLQREESNMADELQRERDLQTEQYSDEHL